MQALRLAVRRSYVAVDAKVLLLTQYSSRMVHELVI